MSGMKGMRIGMFGGSFHPPHLGHLRAAEFFAASYCLQKVLIFPAGISPLKEPLQGVSGEDRLALCILTFPKEFCEVCDWELRREGPSYTIDTLRHVREEYPEAKLFLLIGEDQHAQFRQWKNWQEILELAELVVLPRDRRCDQGKSWTRAAPQERGIYAVRNKEGGGFVPLPISSTELRIRLARGEEVSAYLAPEALQYIHERGLYDTTGLP